MEIKLKFKKGDTVYFPYKNNCYPVEKYIIIRGEIKSFVYDSSRSLKVEYRVKCDTTIHERPYNFLHPENYLFEERELFTVRGDAIRNIPRSSITTLKEEIKSIKLQARDYNKEKEKHINKLNKLINKLKKQ